MKKTLKKSLAFILVFIIVLGASPILIISGIDSSLSGWVKGSFLFEADAAGMSDYDDTTEDPTPINVTGVQINTSAKVLEVGTTYQLIATVLPSDATNKNVTWSSSNVNVAVVDNNGNVTAKAVGVAEIKVCTVDGKKTESCILSVMGSAAIILTKPSTTTIDYGDTLVMVVKVDNMPDGVKVIWSVTGNYFTINYANNVNSNGEWKCELTSANTGCTEVMAKLVYEDGTVYKTLSGKEVFATQKLNSRAGWWQKFVSFIKNIFGISGKIYENIVNEK